MNETEDNSLQSLTQDFRAAAFALGVSGEAVARMAKSPERALACVQECERQNAGPGLAVHMFDAGDWPKERKRGTNLHSASTCETCDGDHFVLVSKRPVIASSWMVERGIVPPASGGTEEYAPCPDCGPDASFRRVDGSMARPPSVEHVRGMMKE